MNRKQYLQLVEQLTPRIRAAFEQAMAELAGAQDMAALERAIQAGDIEAAIQVLDLDPGIVDELREQLRSAFRAGGQAQAAAVSAASPVQFAVYFAIGNQRAERAAAEISGRLIVELLEDVREGVRERIAEGIRAGENPKRTALNIVGRTVPRAPQHRVGGIVGLNSLSRSYVRNARIQLARAHRVRAIQALLDAGAKLGDLPAEMRETYRNVHRYFDRRARDRRFDSAIRKAMATGKPLSEATREKIAARYASRLLKIRGETIARTEAIMSLNAGRYEAMRQVIEKGVDADLVSGEWSDSRDPRVRDQHRLMNGQKVAWGEPFVAPETGSLLRYPGDSELGALARDTVNCRCFVFFEIDWIRWARRQDAVI